MSTDERTEAVSVIRRLLANNLDRPLTHDVLVSQMEGAYSPADVRMAVWYGVSVGTLDFTPDWQIVGGL